MKDIKTIKRNRLSLQNLEACLLAKQEFLQNEIAFTQEMYSRYEAQRSKIVQPSSQNPSSMILENEGERSENHPSLTSHEVVRSTMMEEEKESYNEQKSKTNFDFGNFSQSLTKTDNKIIDKAHSLFQVLIEFSAAGNDSIETQSLSAQRQFAQKRSSSENLVNDMNDDLKELEKLQVSFAEIEKLVLFANFY